MTVNGITDRSVLLIGHSNDLSLEVMREAILRKGGAVTMLEVDRYPQETSLEYRVSGNFATLTWKDGEGHFDLNKPFASVWHRDPYSPSPLIQAIRENVEHEQLQELTFVASELKRVLRGVFALQQNCLHICDPRALLRADNKLCQIEEALAVGFSVPDTLVSNSPSAISKFLRAGKRVLKGFSPYSIYRGGEQFVSYTARINDELIEEVASAGEGCPAIYQDLIEKDHELRIFVCGPAVFALKIEVIDSGLDAPDWRASQNFKESVKFTAIQVPGLMREMLLRYMESFDLVQGSFDFIVDREGQVFFLECNPSGQFIWMEAFCPELAIVDCVANYLMMGERDLDGRHHQFGGLISLSELDANRGTRSR